MSFINEFVLESDVIKHGLDEVKRAFNPITWIKGRPSIFKHSWTIDRERKCFLVHLGAVKEVGATGRSESSSQSEFLLDLDGKRFHFTLNKGARTSKSPGDVPYRVDWEMVSKPTAGAHGIPEPEVLAILKEALLVYGVRGGRVQFPQTEILFNF